LAFPACLVWPGLESRHSGKIIVCAYPLIGCEPQSRPAIACDRRTLRGAQVTPRSALLRCKSRPIRIHVIPSSLYLPQSHTRFRTKKPREKRSVSVAHSCAEKNSEYLSAKTVALAGLEAGCAPKSERVLHSCRPERSIHHRSAGFSSGPLAGDTSQVATSAPAERRSLYLVCIQSATSAHVWYIVFSFCFSGFYFVFVRNV
jgi:hypothetical protein